MVTALMILMMDLNMTTTVTIVNAQGPSAKKIAKLSNALAIEPVYVLDPGAPDAGYGLIGFVSEDTGLPAIELVRFNLTVAQAAAMVFAATREGSDLYTVAAGTVTYGDSLPDILLAYVWAATWFEGEGVPVEDLVTEPLELPEPYKRGPLSWYEEAEYFQGVSQPYVPGAAKQHAEHLLKLLAAELADK